MWKQAGRQVVFALTLVIAGFGCSRSVGIVGSWEGVSATGSKSALRATFEANGRVTMEYVIATHSVPPSPPKPSLIETQRGTYSLQGDRLTMRLYTMEIDNVGREYDEHVPYSPGATKLSTSRDGLMRWKSTDEFEWMDRSGATIFTRSSRILY